MFAYCPVLNTMTLNAFPVAYLPGTARAFGETFRNIFENLPIFLLSMIVLFVAFSVHESAHGYVAYKLGDPTARNLGRITLNPFKHMDFLGFLSMVFFHIGWAKPVPITTRNFRNPKRDMALTGAAGPISNLILAVIHLIVLRLLMIYLNAAYADEAGQFVLSYMIGEPFKGSVAFTVWSLMVCLLYLGIVMNTSLAIFNLLPVPPFDGSRIFYAFLPPKWYFGIMKYEKVIMVVFLFLLIFGFASGPLMKAENWVLNGLFTLTGMGSDTEEMMVMNSMRLYVQELSAGLFR